MDSLLPLLAGACPFSRRIWSAEMTLDALEVTHRQ